MLLLVSHGGGIDVVIDNEAIIFFPFFEKPLFLLVASFYAFRFCYPLAQSLCVRARVLTCTFEGCLAVLSD